MHFGDEEEVDHVDPPAVPATDLADGFRRIAGRSNPPPPIFHPLAYRGVVAEWPVEWRERWGRRANALEESGLSWRDAEAQAFVEVWKEIRREQPAESATPNVTSSEPARN
ncbi:MAG TPA: hypothetical protein VHS97_23485 [Isosphaeraceae bacterium]|jgi:hypothetical protein|nr:hypothetical protein [Isosphaeraceae bacterium]